MKFKTADTNLNPQNIFKGTPYKFSGFSENILSGYYNVTESDTIFLDIEELGTPNEIFRFGTYNSDGDWIQIINLPVSDLETEGDYKKFLNATESVFRRYVGNVRMAFEDLGDALDIDEIKYYLDQAQRKLVSDMKRIS